MELQQLVLTTMVSVDWLQVGRWVITGAAGLVAAGIGIVFPLQVKVQAPEASMVEIYTVLWDCLVDTFYHKPQQQYRKITTDELCKQLASEEAGERPVVVDTRTENDFREGHIEGSLFIPFNTFREDFKAQLPRDKPIVIACQFGHYSVVAVNMMLRAGYEKVYDYSEGMEEWTKQKKPQAKGLPPGYYGSSRGRRTTNKSKAPVLMTESLEPYRSSLLNKTNAELVKPVYMDYNATTPIDPRVLDCMIPYLTHQYGNAASRTHSLGTDAERAVYVARQQIGSVIHAACPNQVVFTSGASESNNLAIKGVAQELRRRDPSKNHIITCVTEHKAVLDTCQTLEDDGFDVTYLKVQPDTGLIDLNDLKQAFSAKTMLVSIMLANNEIGVIQPFRQIGKLCHDHGVLFHSDGTQGVGKMDVNVERDHIDLLSISAHKIYGPKGVGALYVNSATVPHLKAQIHGGGHECGMRSGTLNVPGIVALGECCRLAEELRQEEGMRLAGLRNTLLQKLTAGIPHSQVNGSMVHRLEGNLHICFAGVTSEEILMEVGGEIAISSGSACNSRKTGPSHVVQALGTGIGPDMIGCTLRFGVGRFTTPREIDFVAERLIQVITAARKQKGWTPTAPTST